MQLYLLYLQIIPTFVPIKSNPIINKTSTAVMKKKTILFASCLLGALAFSSCEKNLYDESKQPEKEKKMTDLEVPADFDWKGSQNAKVKIASQSTATISVFLEENCNEEALMLRMDVDANVSVRPKGQKEFGTRCEIKNLNSFKFLQAAIDYEVRRQIELISEGGKVVQATRLYDPDNDETREMRTKEDSMDYRYFPDPDLQPLEISDEWIDEVRATMPELPGAALNRLIQEYGINEADAIQLTSHRPLTVYFETAAANVKDKKAVANWIRGEVLAKLNAAELTIEESPVFAEQVGQILNRMSDGTLNQKGARTVFSAIWEKKGDNVDALIETLGLKQISDTGAIEAAIDAVLAANPKMVAEFKSGKEKAFNALVGQTMRATKGKANPAQVNEILRAKLAQ